MEFPFFLSFMYIYSHLYLLNVPPVQLGQPYLPQQMGCFVCRLFYVHDNIEENYLCAMKFFLYKSILAIS